MVEKKQERVVGLPEDPNRQARARLNARQKKAVDEKLLSTMSMLGQFHLAAALDEGGDVDAKYPRGGAGCLESPIWGMTVSMLAAQKFGQGSQHAPAFPAMERVLRLCDPNATDRQGLTPLMHAAAELSDAVEILAERSDLLAVCGNMGDDFDAGWPALFFALNVAHHSVGDAEAERWVKAMCERLVHPKIWEIRSREGLDAFDIASQRGAPHVMEILVQLRGKHFAEEQAAELRVEVGSAKAPSKPKTAL